MTTLRQAAQQALEALCEFGYHGSSPRWERTSDALREALAQPEQEPSQWREMVVVTLVREGINKHKARELADHFAAQRPWQGLTEFQFAEIYNKWNDTNGSTPWGLNQALEAKLRKLNT